MPQSPPPVEQPYSVLVLGIGGYADGVYDVADLGTLELMPSELQQWAHPRISTTVIEAVEQLRTVNAVVVGSDGTGRLLQHTGALGARFHLASEYPGVGLSVWVNAAWVSNP